MQVVLTPTSLLPPLNEKAEEERALMEVLPPSPNALMTGVSPTKVGRTTTQHRQAGRRYVGRPGSGAGLRRSICLSVCGGNHRRPRCGPPPRPRRR